MLRLSFSRRVAGLTLAAAVVGGGLGLGAAAVWPGSGADAQATSGAGTPSTISSSTTTSATTSPSVPAQQRAPSSAAPQTPASHPVTLAGATAVAVRVTHGRVTDVKQDDEALGLRYDVTLVQADGSSTDVEIDAATGRVLTITHDADQAGN